MIELALLKRSSPVVRGGSSRSATALTGAVQRALELGGRPVLSVFIIDNEDDFESAVLRACVEGPIVHGKVQVSTVGDLIDAGFQIADERDDDESECHFHVYFPTPVTDLASEAWLSCFGEPVPNPAKEVR